MPIELPLPREALTEEVIEAAAQASDNAFYLIEETDSPSIELFNKYLIANYHLLNLQWQANDCGRTSAAFDSMQSVVWSLRKQVELAQRWQSYREQIFEQIQDKCEGKAAKNWGKIAELLQETFRSGTE